MTERPLRELSGDPPKRGFAAFNERKRQRTFSLGLFTWLAIVEKEADKLSEGGQNALGLLREDLEKLASDE